MKCPKCESSQVSKNGRHHGKQNYICKQCSRQFVESAAPRGYSEDAKQICLRMYANGISFRAIERLTGISHNTIIRWVRQAVASDTPETEESAETNSDTKLSLSRFLKSFYIYLNHDLVVQPFEKECLPLRNS